jgi:hypothetical protein
MSGSKYLKTEVHTHSCSQLSFHRPMFQKQYNYVTATKRVCEKNQILESIIFSLQIVIV